MKTTYLFFVALFLIALTAGNSWSQNSRFTFNPVGEEQLYIPVICDGEVVDELVGDGTVTLHGTAHWINGNPAWSRVVINGYLTSQVTGEVFHIHEKDKMEFDENWQIIGDTHTAHINVVGDNGTHLVMSGIFYTLTDFELDKAMCVPNSRK